MTLAEQWQGQKRAIEDALAAGRIDSESAAQMLSHLDSRIKRRPLILKRRKDRKAWQEAQRAKLRAGSAGAP